MIEVRREDVVRLIAAHPGPDAERVSLYWALCREEYASLGGAPSDIDAALSGDVK